MPDEIVRAGAEPEQPGQPSAPGEASAPEPAKAAAPGGASPGAIAAWAALALVVWVFSWFYAGANSWIGVLVLGVLILIGVAREKHWRSAGLLVAVLGGALFVGLAWPVSFVHVDNFSGRDLRIDLDGRSWLESPAGSTRVVRIRKGAHQIALLDSGGAKLRELPVTVPRRSSNYVLNALGAMTYFRGSVTYSSTPYSFGGGDRESRVTSEWFEADVDYLFKEPPSSITVQGSGSGSTQKTYLRRASPGEVPRSSPAPGTGGG